MIEVILKEKAETLNHVKEIDPDADVFEVIMHTTREILNKEKKNRDMSRQDADGVG